MHGRLCPNCKGDMMREGCTHGGFQPRMIQGAEWRKNTKWYKRTEPNNPQRFYYSKGNRPEYTERDIKHGAYIREGGGVWNENENAKGKGFDNGLNRLVNLPEELQDDFMKNSQVESFEAREFMKGTSFDIGEIEWPVKKYIEERDTEEIKDMIEQIRERMEHYKREYKLAKKDTDKGGMVYSIRNWKALQGAHQALRWALGEQGVEHPLY